MSGFPGILNAALFGVAAGAALAALATGADPVVALAAFGAGAGIAVGVRRLLVERQERPIEDARRLTDALQQRISESDTQRARLGAVIAAMGEGVLVVGADRRVLLANPRLRDLFSAPESLEGGSLLAAVRHAEVVDGIESALATGASEVREVAIGPAPERRLRFSVAPFASPEDPGRRAGAVAVFRDVTELRRIESVRRDFVANASHELKTPLTAIRGFAERLADAELPDTGAKQAVEAILGNAKRLGALVEDLLELSRIESGSMPLRPEAVAVGDLVRRLVHDLDSRLRSGDLSVRVDVEGSDRAHVDRRALEHVLMNLLDNAIKYTAPAGEIAVRVAERPGDRLRVEVRDTGIGIPRKDLPRIFERFYRVDPGRSRAIGGTGLGLAIAKHWVQAIGGAIGVESQLGQGSMFWIELPA